MDHIEPLAAFVCFASLLVQPSRRHAEALLISGMLMAGQCTVANILRVNAPRG